MWKNDDDDEGGAREYVTYRDRVLNNGKVRVTVITGIYNDA